MRNFCYCCLLLYRCTSLYFLFLFQLREKIYSLSIKRKKFSFYVHLFNNRSICCEYSSRVVLYFLICYCIHPVSRLSTSLSFTPHCSSGKHWSIDRLRTVLFYFLLPIRIFPCVLLFLYVLKFRGAALTSWSAASCLSPQLPPLTPRPPPWSWPMLSIRSIDDRSTICDRYSIVFVVVFLTASFILLMLILKSIYLSR